MTVFLLGYFTDIAIYVLRSTTWSSRISLTVGRVVADRYLVFWVYAGFENQGHCVTLYQFDIRNGLHNPHPSNPIPLVPNQPDFQGWEIYSIKSLFLYFNKLIATNLIRY
jgi:hypothetical protein